MRQADVRRIALSLPDVVEKEGHFAFEIPVGDKLRGICWVWMERVHPKKARVPNPDVLAVRVADLDAKDMLLMAEPRKFFTEPHYAGFPAVLVRLAEIGAAELRRLLVAAQAAYGDNPRKNSAKAPRKRAAARTARR
jgi:hypothetical protein